MQFVEPMTWDEAVDKIGDKSIITSALNSEQWRDVPVALRERAFFSSRVESARFLQSARDFLTDYLAQNYEISPNGSAIIKAGGRAQFVKELSEFGIAHGLGPLDAHDAGTLKDITSETRLNLIFDVMTQSAHDFTYWKQGMDPDTLNEFPAQRFVRERDVKVPRPYHQDALGMVALKSDLPFWIGLNRDFGVPWGPWGFNSGCGVEDVDRDAAESLGLITASETPKPVVEDFNKRLEASTQGLAPEMVAKLQGAFGDQVEFSGDTVKWRGKDAPAPQRKRALDAIMLPDLQNPDETQD